MAAHSHLSVRLNLQGVGDVTQRRSLNDYFFITDQIVMRKCAEITLMVFHDAYILVHYH